MEQSHVEALQMMSFLEQVHATVRFGLVKLVNIIIMTLYFFDMCMDTDN